MRGKATSFSSSGASTGITPACAGKRAHRHGTLQPDQDHPRVCGEKTSIARRLLKSQGSPPRVRGKAPFSYVIVTPHRITPACAGKRSSDSLSHLTFWDHPRVCGEKRRLCPEGAKLRGSPPRVRGKDPHTRCDILYRRITPACAGKRLKKVLKIKGFQMRSYVISFSLMNTSCSNEASFSALWHCLPPSLKASIRSVSLYFPSELSRFLARVSVSINRGSYCPSPS